MTNRREMLMGMLAGSVALPAAALAGSPGDALVAANAAPPETKKERCECCGTGEGDAGSIHIFPNAIVHTQRGERALFYNDLLRGKRVLINFMSLENEKRYPVTTNLVKVQRLLGDQVGRDVFMYTVTVDPEHDTPQALQVFADKHGVGPGWQFLTGDPQAIALVRESLFTHGLGRDLGSQGHEQQGHNLQGHDCSLGIVRYGNVAANVWGSVPAKSPPHCIVERIAWVQSRPAPVGLPVRKGPRPLV